MKQLFILICVIGTAVQAATAQTITYTHQHAVFRGRNFLQLVGGIGQTNHLIVWAPHRPSYVYVYDDALRLNDKVLLPFTIPEDCLIRIVPFRRFYYIFYQVPDKKGYGIWRVEEDGRARDIQPAFNRLLESDFAGGVTITFDMNVFADSLYITSLLYRPSAGTTTILQIKADGDLKPLANYKVPFAFDMQHERIRTAVLATDQKFILLKSGTDSNANHLLETVHVNLHTGESIFSYFNAGLKNFTMPSLYYNKSDSSTTIYSLVRGMFNAPREQYIFLARIDGRFAEQIVPTSIRSLYPCNFMLVNTEQPQWITLNNGYRAVRFVRSTSINNLNGYNEVGDTRRIINSMLPANSYYNTGAPPIRFFMLNKAFSRMSDTTVLNDKNKYSLFADDCGKFNVNGNSYLVLKQQFRSSTRGLSLFWRGEDGRIASSDLRVYSRNDYWPSQLQQMRDGSVLIPYTYKSEAGLMRVRMNRSDLY